MSRARSLADLISGNAIIEGAEIATSTIPNDRLISAGQLTLGSTALTLGATTTAIAGLSTVGTTGAVTIEPQIHVDAQLQQITMDKRLARLPPSLQSLNLFQN